MPLCASTMPTATSSGPASSKPGLPTLLKEFPWTPLAGCGRRGSAAELGVVGRPGQAGTVQPPVPRPPEPTDGFHPSEDLFHPLAYPLAHRVPPMPGRPPAIDKLDPDVIGVLRRVVGHQAKGKKPYLNQLQQRALVAKAQQGQFRTVWDVIEWVGRWRVRYTYKGMYTLMKGHGLGLKVPRPHSEKADAQQQATWKKGVCWMPWPRIKSGVESPPPSAYGPSLEG